MEAFLALLTAVAFLALAVSAGMLVYFVRRPSEHSVQRRNRGAVGFLVSLAALAIAFPAQSLLGCILAALLMLSHVIQHECDVEMGF
jgi:beta-lactamase regulating signal transducer with metallopeptidase domain